MERKLADRRSNFKKNFDDPRRKREDLQLQIRKTHREQNLAKKRMEAFEPQQQQDAAPFLGPSSGMGAEGFMSSSSSSSSSSSAAPGDLLGSAAAAGGGMGGVAGDVLQPQQVVMGSGEGASTTCPGAAGAAADMNNSTEGGQQQQVVEQQAGSSSSTAGAGAAGKKYVFKGSELPDMMRMLRSDNPEEVFRSTELFRRALSIESKPPIQEVIDAGAVPLFVGLLECDDRPRLQFEAAWALTNIASGTQEQTQVVIQHGAVPIFVKLLASPTDDVREQAVWALGNIAGDSPQCRNLVLQAGALSPLLKQLNDPNVKYTMKRNATWTLWSRMPAGRCRIFRMAPMIASMRYLRRSRHIFMVWGCARRSAADDTGNRDQIQRVLDEGLLPRLIELLKWGDFDIRREAAWAVSNAASGGNDQQVESLVMCGCIGPLCELLKTADVKIVSVALEALENVLRVGKVKMETMQLRENPYCRLIEEANGLTVLEKLQDATSHEIYDKFLLLRSAAPPAAEKEEMEYLDAVHDAWRIICTYFPHEEVDEGNEIDVDPTGMLGAAAGSNNAFEADSTLQQQVFGAAAPQGGFHFGE